MVRKSHGALSLLLEFPVPDEDHHENHDETGDVIGDHLTRENKKIDTMTSLRIKLAHPLAQRPTRGSESAAGYDLRSVEACVVEPGKRAVVSTGLVIEIPPGTYGRVAPRSGLAVQHGIDVFGGVVDADYRGIVKVILHNSDPEDAFVIEPGDRIAQLVLERHETPDVEIVDDVDDTSRGEGGFGSTGRS